MRAIERRAHPVTMRTARTFGRAVYVCILALPLTALMCYTHESATPPPAEASAKEVAMSGAVVMLAVGDIARCGFRGDEATGAIVDSVLRADSAAKVENVVATMGDNAYPSGTEGPADIFTRCFKPSWGGALIMKAIKPSPGNHDFENQGGPGYYVYFGDRAGPTGKGYFSYDIGDWHAISLNSEILGDPAFTAQEKAQEDWLRQDLKDHSKPCTLAYWHRPLFSSGAHGSSPEVLGLWNILYNAGVDLILNGHDHDYERFVPMTPAGLPDSVKGIEEIVAGTGGGELRGMNYPLALHSLVQIHGYFGVLKLTLGKDEYRHAFIDTGGRVWDSSGRKCH